VRTCIARETIARTVGIGNRPHVRNGKGGVIDRHRSIDQRNVQRRNAAGALHKPSELDEIERRRNGRNPRRAYVSGRIALVSE
jgi:hypothetical protein